MFFKYLYLFQFHLLSVKAVLNETLIVDLLNITLKKGYIVST